jgi:glycine/D-amino acid oxidase-like deaminating enzyme
MGDADFDVIVIGAGMAGLCCAGELVLRGARPLLVCETPEVGWTTRSQWIQGNRGVLQQPIWQLGWGGGWWYQLVRRLNLAVRIYPPLPLEATVRGTGVFADLPICASAASIADLLTDMSAVPLNEIRPELERLVHEALAMPDEALFGLDRVSMAQWLDDHGADEMTKQGLLNLAAAMSECPVELASELSAFGAWAILRGMFAGEALFVTVYPDAQEGLCVPLANEVERRGGAVWRGRRVARVLTEGSRAVGVALRDGTVARAPMVAIAAGNPRISALFDDLPPEVAAPLSYSEQFVNRDFTVYTLLGREVIPPQRARFTAIMDSNSPHTPMDLRHPRVAVDDEAGPSVHGYSTQPIAPGGGGRRWRRGRDRGHAGLERRALPRLQ